MDVTMIDFRKFMIQYTCNIVSYKVNRPYHKELGIKLNSFMVNRRSKINNVLDAAFDLSGNKEDSLPKRLGIRRSILETTDAWWIDNDGQGTRNWWNRARIYKVTKMHRHLYHGIRTNKWLSETQNRSARA